jgi:senataxin
MNNEAILSETRAYIVKALDRFKDDVPLPKTVQQNMLGFIDAQLAEPDADRRKTLLSTTELQELRGLLIPAGSVVEISDDEDDFQIVTPPAQSAPSSVARSADHKDSPTTVSSFWQASQSAALSASQERKRRMKQQKLSWAKAKPIDVDALPTPPSRPAAPAAPRPSANKYQPAGARAAAPKASGGLLSTMRHDFAAQRQVIFRPNNVNQRPRLPSDRDLAAPIKAPAAYSTVTGAQPEGGLRKATTAAPASDSTSESSSDDEEDGDQAKGLAALTGRKAKSPIKMRRAAAVTAAAPPRRTMMLHDTRAEDLARERAEAERKRRLRAPADFGQLHRSILSWPFHVDGEEPPTLPGQPPARFLPVPAAGFTSAEQYANVFGPMLLLESWAELQNAKEEIARGAPEKRPINVEIVSRSSVDGFIDLTASLPAGLISSGPKGFRLMDTDVVYLSELAGASAVAPQQARTVLAKVEAFRSGHGNSGVTLRCCIASDRQGVGSALVPGSRWQLGKLFALTTLHRECAALMAFADFDLVGDVLHGRAASRSPIPNADIEAVMAQHAVNRPQAEAIIGAMSSEKGISLIQGPPGTGKTKTICSLVAHFIATRRAPATSVQAGRAGVREPKRKILLCAPSNAAIDEVARRAQQGFRSRDGKIVKPVVVRVGREETMNVGVKHISLDALLEARLAAHSTSGETGAPQDPSVIHAEIKSLRDEKEAKLHELETERANGGGNAARIGQLQAEVKNLSARRMAAMSRLDEAKDQRQTRARQAEADRRRVQYEILADADVVCTTLAGAGHPLLGQLPFDFETVVIDEAAQAVELSSLIPLRYGCRRAILVGDPNQLPPTVISQRAQRLKYAQSLFVRIFEAASSSVYLLSIQYRMHPLISSFPSRVFYDSKLSDGPGMAELTAQPWHKETLLKPFRFFDAYRGAERSARGHSVVNSEEAQIAAALYERLKAEARRYSKDLDYRVGVVTMYKEQVFELKRTFLARFGPDVTDVVDFNTVDGFQGQEKDVIILSAVRTNAVGFLSDRRRVNVALTRAKSNVFVIGCAKLLRTDALWGTLVSHADQLGVLSSVVPTTFSMLAAQAAPRKSLPSTSASPAPRKSATAAAAAVPTSAGAMTPAQLRKQTPASSKASPAGVKRSRPPSPSGTPPVIPAPPPPPSASVPPGPAPGPPPKRPRIDAAPVRPSQPPAQYAQQQSAQQQSHAQRLQQWKARNVDTSRPSAPPVIRSANPTPPPLSKNQQKRERRAQQQAQQQQQQQQYRPPAQQQQQQAGPSRPAVAPAAAASRPAGPSAAALGSLFVKKKPPPKRKPGAP